MRNPIFTALAVLWPLFAHSQVASAESIELSLKSRAAVLAPYVRVRDVVELSQSDKTPPRGMDAIAAQIRDGETITLTRAQIEAALRDNPAVSQLRIEWTGDDRIVISTRSVRIGGDRLEKVAAQTLTEFAHGFASDVDLSPVRPQEDVLVRSGNGEISVEAQPIGARALGKRMTVWLTISRQGTILRRVQIPFDVTARQLVAIARLPIARHHVIEVSDIEWGERDLASLGAHLPAPSGGVVGKEARADVAYGAVLLERDLSQAWTVRRGERVDLEVAQGAVTLRTTATAIEDGSTNMLVRAQPMGAKDLVVARVMGPHELKLEASENE